MSAPLRYLSVCSGIEAATVAWHRLGWKPVAFAEIEAFPSEVLAYHYGSNLPGERLSHNAPPNLGNIEGFRDWPAADIDVLVGGTPCQSFSVAGLRRGLADPRGNLALVYLAIADRYRPTWILWENVPGVLSSGGGRDFGAFLGGLVQLGYGFAYRVLDAQYVRIHGLGRAVPQRRRRVFVVGCLGDWRRAAAVLFDAASLRGDSAPRRCAGQGIARPIASSPPGGSGYRNGTGRGTPLVLICFSSKDHGADYMLDCSPTLRAGTHTTSHANAGIAPAIIMPEPFTLAVRGRDGLPIMTPNGGRAGIGVGAVADDWRVRRLTPLECERLQGFPDGYTAIRRANGKSVADGPRYRALGNSMAVNVMRWIGRRIARVDAIGRQIGFHPSPPVRADEKERRET